MSSKEALLFLLLGMTSSVTLSLTPPSSSSSSPWMDTSLCSMTDSLLVCQLKKGICSPIHTIFSPPGGPVKAVTDCANNTGATLGPQFFMSVGLSFLSGSPESLADKASSDPPTATAIRRCALNATGLLNPDMLTLNRTTIEDKLSSAFVTPELGEAVAAAVATCPEPIDYKITDFMTCLKVACMNSASVSPFISMAKTSLTGTGTPISLAAAKKTVIPKSTGVAAPPSSSSGSSAYSAGAFTYPGAAGGAGAFPYVGAGGAGAAGAGAAGAGSASSSSSGSAYMTGAFPYAGAGSFPVAGASGGSSGAGAFPFAGASGASSGSGAGGAGSAGAFTFPSSTGAKPVTS